MVLITILCNFKISPDKLLGVVAMLSAILILAALPWLDTSKIRSAVFRPLYKQFYWILLLMY